jgi:hypothetical protein
LKRSRVRLILCALAALPADGGAALSGEPPLPPPRPAELTPAAPPKPEAPAPQPPAPAGPQGAAPTCLSRLIASGARAEAATQPPSTIEGCGIASPIRLLSVTLASGDAVALSDQPLLDCEFAFVFADYVRLIVAPLGDAMLHAKIASIATGPGFECRSRDHLADAKISAHGHGLALDFSAIEFADKRRVLVEHPANADETSYFRAIRTAACGWFTTVLGPGSDAFHANHMHLDIEKHGANSSYRICE